MVNINLIDGANEPLAKPGLSRAWGEDVTDECSRIRQVQLDRRHLFFPSSYADGGAASGAQVARPIGLAEGAD
jgi:hypothetical protein